MEKLTLVLVALFVPFVLALCYMTPATIALRRHHPQHAAIRTINLFAGWTVIGWIVALAWSLSHRDGATEETPGFIRATEPRLSIVHGAMNEVWTEIEVIDGHNGDRAERGSLVQGLKPGDNLHLVRVGTADTSTVGACLGDGRLIGELAADVATRVATNLEGNRRVDCRVLDVSGGGGSACRIEAMLTFHVLRAAAPSRSTPSRVPISAAGSG